VPEPDPRSFDAGPIHVRIHGEPSAGEEPGPVVVVLHGGPGAPGCAEALARGLADRFRVLEPWQRWSGAKPLTTEGHIADLVEAVDRHAPEGPVAWVGESYGAMLALAFAAAHPERVRRLALVGCGTYDTAARAQLHATLAERTTAEMRARLEVLERSVADPGERMARQHALLDRLYTYERAPDAGEPEPGPIDERGHRESFADMLDRQAAGIDPASFAAIDVPVLMLHGDYDPHPGEAIHARLAPWLRDLEYVSLARCGHSPWIERHARESFFEHLRRFLSDAPPQRAGPS